MCSSNRFPERSILFCLFCAFEDLEGFVNGFGGGDRRVGEVLREDDFFADVVGVVACGLAE